MGYFNIIDSLNDKRVDEGMVSSISKNTKKQSKDVKRMVDALIGGQISKLSSKDMDINIEVRNDTKLSSNNKKYEQYCITGTKGGVLRTEVRGYEINGEYFVAIIGYNLLKGTTVGVAKERNRIEMILNNRKGGHSLRFFKDGKSKIKLSGGLI